MAAATYALNIEQGATFAHTFIWRDNNSNPIDLTGYTARMHIREAVSSPDPALLELTTANSRITITPLAGKLELEIDAEDTEALEFTDGVYDLELVSAGGKVTRLLKGTVKVDPEVTR